MLMYTQKTYNRNEEALITDCVKGFVDSAIDLSNAVFELGSMMPADCFNNKYEYIEARKHLLSNIEIAKKALVSSAAIFDRAKLDVDQNPVFFSRVSLESGNISKNEADSFIESFMALMARPDFLKNLKAL